MRQGVILSVRILRIPVPCFSSDMISGKIPPFVLRMRILTLSASIFITTSCLAQTETRANRPWSYWWWMGSAVDSVNIQRQLLAFSNAGLGGVHIVPIYGVQGYEQQSKRFLSEEWINLLAYTTHQAREFQLGLDITMGTGWPFGGPHIAPQDAAKKFVIENSRFSVTLTGQQVKRAAPGGEGPVIDYYDSAAVVRYFAPFVRLSSVSGIRSIYHDSYEAYGANWTTNFDKQFERRRGYRLSDKMNAFKDSSSTDGKLVRIDYQQTLSELLHDEFAKRWTRWAKDQKYLTRYQAHGSPGNILDLYALADIPETESFGTSQFSVPGVRVDDHYEVERFGTPDVLAMKFASSAAHLTGKRLVSSETGTWLADHFKVALSQVKPQIDELFTAGINHVFYHGITYSPANEGFPGWLFYASTNFGPQSHLWKHLPYLNAWVTRCQQRLQSSAADNDILLYFPIHDVWSKTKPGDNPIQLLDVHHTEKWLRNSPFGETALELMNSGLSFDYVSDSLLQQLSARRGQVLSNGQSYKVIVVPPVEFMPVRTLRKLGELLRAGVSIVFVEHTPKAPAGLRASKTAFMSEGRAGGIEGTVVKSSKLVSLLERLGARREGFAGAGLSFIRKRSSQGSEYFVANLSNQFTSGWVRVSERANRFQRYDPLTSETEYMPVRWQVGSSELYLELLPGESAFITAEVSGSKASPATPWSMIPIAGNWAFSFEEGKPSIYHTIAIDELRSWTELADSAQYFYGAGRYQIDFSATADALAAKQWVLDLGDVREVADVRLNGQSIGTAWSAPFRLRIPTSLLQRNNELEIVVSNLSVNYMRLFDRLHPEWKKFYDINMVDIRYKPYSAVDLPAMPSGLLGPVRLYYR